MFVRSNAIPRILMLLLPAAIFVAAVLYYLSMREREGVEEILGKTASATVAALDRQIESEIAVLAALASSPTLDDGDLSGFLGSARRVIPTHDGWSSIAITDQARVLGSTVTGVLDQPRTLLDSDTSQDVFRTARPSVSGIFPATERTSEPFYIVRVPVIRDGAVKYTLSAAVRAWSLHGTLKRLPVPAGGRIGFLDRDGKVLARSNSTDSHDRMIGNLPSQSVLDGIRGGHEGLFQATPVDGDPVYMVGRRHELSGWIALISAPKAALDAPRRSMLALAGGGAGVALLLTILVGMAMARSTTRRVEAERRVTALEAETRKRHAEDLLAKVMDALPVGVFVNDGSGQIVSVNPEAHRIWGTAPSVGIDRYGEYKGWHRDTGRRIEGHEWAAARALLKGETIRDEIVDIESFDGQRKSASVSAHPLIEDGRIVGAVSIISDITERHRLAEELRLSNERMRLVLNANVIGIVTAVADGALLEVNDFYLDLVGYSRAEFDAWLLDWRELTPSEYLPLDECALAEVTQNGMSAPYEKEYALRGGSRVWVYIVLAKLAGTGTIVAFVQNFTHRRRAEEQKELAMRQAEMAREEAEQANLSKSKFLAAASHDIRQPVQSLFFMLSALEGRVMPEAQKMLAHANEALSALKSLLDSLLDISRLDAGTVTPELREFPISALLDQIGAEYKPLAEAKGLEWHVVGCTATVRSDPVLLGRMVRNLCQNAIRYTEAGNVLVRCRSLEGALQIEVEDTGIGIPADKQDAIFEEFQQLPNDHPDRRQGLGLGLAIVRRLSTLLEHPVEVRSAPGRGSTFTVTVPMTGAPMARRVDAEVIPIARGDGAFIVVIDDEELVRLGTTTLIESWGYEVFGAASAPLALVALQGSQRVPQLIISDYRLPDGKNGIDAIRGIRALFNTAVPAVLMTGETSRECADVAAAEGIAVIHKPVPPSQLHAILHVKATKPDKEAVGIG